MRQVLPIALICLMHAGMAACQGADPLGPHLNFGRGCGSCHVQHGAEAGDSHAGAAHGSFAVTPLWGEAGAARELVKAIEVEESRTPQSHPASLLPEGPKRRGVLICLSCHDGNYAPQAMIRDEEYEALPAGYESLRTIPTLTDRPAITTGLDMSGHPIGAPMGCGGAHNWDCTETDGAISMRGPHAASFAAHYGYFVQPRQDGNAAVVVCTTCHNPHSWREVRVDRKLASVLFPKGAYSTSYFLRAPYNPAQPGAGISEAADFCRQCHADKSNEMNGSPAGSMM